MKNHPFHYFGIGLALFVLLSSLTGCDPDATYTTIYMVRHAEVVYKDGETNPHLTDEGKTRAIALKDQLSGMNLTAIYQTEKFRTRETAAPTAEHKGITPTEINDGLNQQLVDDVLANHADESVLIVNHSHNIINIIQRFNATPPFTTYPSEFDKLFLIIHKEKEGSSTSGIAVFEYGEASP